MKKILIEHRNDNHVYDGVIVKLKKALESGSRSVYVHPNLIIRTISVPVNPLKRVKHFLIGE